MILIKDTIGLAVCFLLIGAGSMFAAFPYVVPHLNFQHQLEAALPAASDKLTSCASPDIPALPEGTFVPQWKLDNPKTVIWQIPENTHDVQVTVYNKDNSWSATYTITNYISLSSGQKLKVEAK